VERAVVASTGNNVPPVAKKQKPNPEDCVTLDKDYQALLKKTTNKKQQVSLLIEADKAIHEKVVQGLKLADPLKSWIFKRGKIVACVEDCHGGSIDSFLDANKTVAMSRFTTCGKGVKHCRSYDSNKIEI
jgi:hypothetical protein